MLLPAPTEVYEEDMDDTITFLLSELWAQMIANLNSRIKTNVKEDLGEILKRKPESNC